MVQYYGYTLLLPLLKIPNMRHQNSNDCFFNELDMLRYNIYQEKPLKYGQFYNLKIPFYSLQQLLTAECVAIILTSFKSISTKLMKIENKFNLLKICTF